MWGYYFKIARQGLDAANKPLKPAPCTRRATYCTARSFDKAGVMFVRDASANKCGVISSSYEIMVRVQAAAAVRP